MNIRPTFLGAVSLVPMAGFGFLTLFALLAYIQVGHWPMYARPDPKDVGPAATGELMRLIVIAFIFAAPTALGVTCGFRGRGEIGARGWHLPVLLLGCILFFAELAELAAWLAD
jgi:hypothetical protein